MSLLKLAWKNIVAKPLNALLSILLLTLGVALISITILMSKNLDENLKKNIKGVNMVIGAKGSPLQIILSSLYHIDAPTGNISLNEANKIAKHFLVKSAVPLSYGDSYKGTRIVGTDISFVHHYELKIKEGKMFSSAFEVCIGSSVAEKFDLKQGDEFFSQHGMDENAEQHTSDPFKVVGIFERSNTIADELIICDLKDIWHVHDHGHDHEHEEGDGHVHEEEEKEITAMLISFRNKNANMMLPRMVNDQSTTQAALPAIEIDRLFSLLGFGFSTLRAIALVLMIISGSSIFISMLQALTARKFELALMKSMGASRLKLFFLLLLESTILGSIGVILGLVISRGVMVVVSEVTEKQYKYQLTSLGLEREELMLIIATFAIVLLASFLPAYRAGRINISKVFAQK
ncbi:MAG: FtsX-like permease family protein [Flavobacteriales bacterium]|nr:FtsX-like permease family protein [Flavobacteriales bacterium]